MNTSTEIGAKLKKLITQGEAKEVLQLLLEITEGTVLQHEVILQVARYKDYEEEKRRGISSYENEKMSRAKINDRLLLIIGQLEQNGTPAIHPKNVKSNNAFEEQKNWWKIIGYMSVLICLLFGLYSIRSFFTKESVDSFSITVLVHGKKGKDQRILKGQGQVVLDIGGDRKTEVIDLEGEATFKELPRGYLHKKVLVSVLHNQPYFPTQRDAVYELKENDVIYLEVALNGMGSIKGRVIDAITEMPLDSVRVSVQNTETYTDEYGWYVLKIPEEKQAKFIRVNFFKRGYKMEDIDSIAPHTNQQIGIALKH